MWKGNPKICIDTLYDFFKNLDTDQNHTIPDYVLSDDELAALSNIEANFIINDVITHDEIISCIKMLKRNKSCGPDHIFNEYIIATQDVLLPVYYQLFNLILDTGIFPKQWLCGDILPI